MAGKVGELASWVLVLGVSEGRVGCGRVARVGGVWGGEHIAY